MTRTNQEWVGRHDDQKVPDYVRLRVFLKYEGKCYLTGRQIRPGDAWEIEHITALCNGGEHRENNMAPALIAPHKIKTKADRREKARTDKRRKSHIGIKKPRTITRWRKFDGSIVEAPRERS